MPAASGMVVRHLVALSIIKLYGLPPREIGLTWSTRLDGDDHVVHSFSRLEQWRGLYGLDHHDTSRVQVRMSQSMNTAIYLGVRHAIEQGTLPNNLAGARAIGSAMGRQEATQWPPPAGTSWRTGGYTYNYVNNGRPGPIAVSGEAR